MKKFILISMSIVGLIQAMESVGDFRMYLIDHFRRTGQTGEPLGRAENMFWAQVEGRGVNYSDQGYAGRTLLEMAALYGSENVAKTLLRHTDIDVNHFDNTKKTALYYALEKTHSKNQEMEARYNRIAEALRKKGAKTYAELQEQTQAAMLQEGEGPSQSVAAPEAVAEQVLAGQLAALAVEEEGAGPSQPIAAQAVEPEQEIAPTQVPDMLLLAVTSADKDSFETLLAQSGNDLNYLNNILKTAKQLTLQERDFPKKKVRAAITSNLQKRVAQATEEARQPEIVQQAQQANIYDQIEAALIGGAEQAELNNLVNEANAQIALDIALNRKNIVLAQIAANKGARLKDEDFENASPEFSEQLLALLQ